MKKSKLSKKEKLKLIEILLIVGSLLSIFFTSPKYVSLLSDLTLPVFVFFLICSIGYYVQVSSKGKSQWGAIFVATTFSAIISAILSVSVVSLLDYFAYVIYFISYTSLWILLENALK